MADKTKLGWRPVGNTVLARENSAPKGGPSFMASVVWGTVVATADEDEGSIITDDVIAWPETSLTHAFEIDDTRYFIVKTSDILIRQEMDDLT